MLNWNYRIKDEINEKENKKDIEVFYFPKTINFSIIDGFINFAIVTINYILKYGNRNAETNRYLRKIRGRLSKISKETVLYKEGTDFGEYQRSVSKVLSQKINREIIEENEGYFGTLEDNSEEDKQLIVLRYKDFSDIELQSRPEYENFKYYVEYLILEQLSSIRLSRQTKAYLLSEYDCHIEIIHAVNYLINATNYLCNGRGGFNEDGLFFTDKMEVEKLIEMSEITIKRIAKMRYLI